MVPVALASLMVAPVAFDTVTARVSWPSSWLSSSTTPVTVFELSLGLKATVNVKTVLPVVRKARSRTRRSASRLPISTREAHTTVHRILTNPVYAGAYAFGRTGSRTHLENGRKRVVRGFRRERDEWGAAAS